MKGGKENGKSIYERICCDESQIGNCGSINRGQGYKESIPSYLKPYLKDEKVRALIPQPWVSLTKLINKVTTQDLLLYMDPVIHRN